MKKMALFIILLSLNLPAFADSHRYQVEVILFQHQNISNSQEEWPDYPTLPETDKAVDYPLLSPSAWLLRDEASRIKNSGQYRLLGHLAWQQAIINYHPQATRLHIQNNLDSGDDWNLDGTLSLTRTNYLTVNANLVLSVAKNSGEMSNSAQPYRQVVLKQQHRMRPKELYYFDQPLFGMLIKIVPVG